MLIMKFMTNTQPIFEVSFSTYYTKGSDTIGLLSGGDCRYDAYVRRVLHPCQEMYGERTYVAVGEPERWVRNSIVTRGEWTTLT